jgi:hypothetical protein
VLGRVAGLHHQLREHVRTDDRDADGQDHETDSGTGDGRQGDPRRDAPADHARAAR